jgi:hypothetical protein
LARFCRAGECFFLAGQFLVERAHLTEDLEGFLGAFAVDL